MSKNKKSDVRGGRTSNTNSNRRRHQPTDASLSSSSKLEEGDRRTATVEESNCIGSFPKLGKGDRRPATVDESDRIATEPSRRSGSDASLSRTQRGGDHTPPTKMQRRREPGQNTGRRSSWPLIRPKLDEIEKLIGEKFVPIRDVPTKYFGISYRTFLVLRDKHPELEEAVQRAKAHRNELVLKGMYDLATGRAVRVEDEKAPDEKGNLRITKRRIIRFEPQADIGTTLMKQYAGWSDNPKTDNAVANALNNKEWTAKISLIPGFSDLSPKSSDADNFKAHPKDIGNRTDAPAVQGENYNSDIPADQKEDNDDDSGE